MFIIHAIHDGQAEVIPYPSGKNIKNLSGVWINLTAPTGEDVAALAPLVEIPDEVIADVRDVNEVPKLDKLDGMLYVLIQTPLAHTGVNSDMEVKYSVTPLAMLITEHCLVTISTEKNDIITYLENKLKNIAHNRIVDTTRQTQFVTKMLLFTAKIYLRYLRELHHRLQIPLSERRLPVVDKEIIDLLGVEQSLVYFDASLRSNYIVMEKVARRRSFTETEDDQELVDDATHEMRQALEVVKVYGHIVEDIRSALSSLISNNLTRTVNWLTKLTLILMLPTLVGTLYGMNVPLPFATSPHAFSIVVGISVVTTLIGTYWIRSKEYHGRVSGKIKL